MTKNFFEQTIDVIYSFVCLFVAYTMVLFLLIPICALIYLFDKELCYLAYRYYCSNIVLSYLRLVGLKINYVNMNNLPKSQCIIVSNHMHMLDTIIIPAFLKSPLTTFVAKQSLSILPMFHDFIFLQRNGLDREFLKQCIKAFRDNGKSICIFPEGTRIGKGEIKPYQKGVAVIARYLKCKVCPITLNTGSIIDRKGMFGFGLIDFNRRQDFFVKFHPALTYDEFLFNHYYKLYSENYKESDNMSMSRLKQIENYLNIHEGLKNLLSSEEQRFTFEQISEDIHIEMQKVNYILDLLDKEDNSTKDQVFTDILQNIINSARDDISETTIS